MTDETAILDADVAVALPVEEVPAEPRIYEIGYHIIPTVKEEDIEKTVGEIRKVIESSVEKAVFIAEVAPRTKAEAEKFLGAEGVSIHPASEFPDPLADAIKRADVLESKLAQAERERDSAIKQIRTTEYEAAGLRLALAEIQNVEEPYCDTCHSNAASIMSDIASRARNSTIIGADIEAVVKATLEAVRLGRRLLPLLAPNSSHWKLRLHADAAFGALDEALARLGWKP